MLTNEAIEAHLRYLHTGLEAVQTELPKLQGKIDALDKKMKNGTALPAKLDRIAEVEAYMLRSQKHLKWLVASLTLLSIAGSLGWT